MPLAAALLTACGGGGSTASNTPDSLSASVAAAHAALSTRPESMVFRNINSAGTKCAALPQDVTLTLGTPKNGKFIVFDDAHDGKELCYTSFEDGEPETVTIMVKNPDGTDFPGSGSAIVLDVSDTYNTSPDPVTPDPAANHVPTANAGADGSVAVGATASLSGSATDADGDTLTFSWAQTGGTPTVELTEDDGGGARPATAISVTPQYFNAPTVTTATTLTFTLTVSDGKGGTATDSVNVLVKPKVQPTPTGKLNDTGITACSNDTQNGQPCPILSHPGQDGDVGRDVTDNDPSDGHAGFSFTKIGADGTALAIQSEAYNESGTEAAGTKWSCVKDNVTGLIWEVKTDDGGLHDKDWTYTWYNTNPAINGGSAGTANGGSCNGTSQCDTSGYVAAVNIAGLCGSSNWRMPTAEELLNLVAFNRSNPAIDL